ELHLRLGALPRGPRTEPAVDELLAGAGGGGPGVLAARRAALGALSPAEAAGHLLARAGLRPRAGAPRGRLQSGATARHGRGLAVLHGRLVLRPGGGAERRLLLRLRGGRGLWPRAQPCPRAARLRLLDAAGVAAGGGAQPQPPAG